MQKLVVINSLGPMASTLLAGLVEKLGFSNVPIRKMRLHQYLMGEIDLNSGVMQDRLEATLRAHSKKGTSGGVSVLDRNNQKPKSLVDYERVAGEVQAIREKNYETIQDLYFDCHKIYNKAVIYKKPEYQDDWHIKLTVDISQFDAARLYERYREEFDDVRFIHLRRDFKGWINALSSQAMFHPDFLQRIRFFPHKRYKDFMLYEDTVAQMPGLDMPFDDLFDVPIEDLAVKIGSFLDVPVPDLDWREEHYDMYGKIQPYSVAFKRFDDSIEFLKPGTLDYYQQMVDAGKFSSFPANLLSWGKYLADSQAYLKASKAGEG